MEIRIAAPQLKQMIDDCLSKGDIRSASSLLKSNSEILQKEFPDWYDQSVLSAKPKKDTRGRIKLICDYNKEIKEAANKKDTKWLSRIKNDAHSKYERNRISEEEYHKISTTINEHLKVIKYSPIFSLVRTNTHPEDWKAFIANQKGISIYDTIIINEILRISKKRIENALSDLKFNSLAKYVKALRDNFFDIKHSNLDLLLVDVLDEKLSQYDDVKRLSIEHDLEKLGVISDAMKNIFKENRRLLTIGKIKSALSKFDFALADSYGPIDDFNYEAEKKKFVDKLKDRIFRDSESPECKKLAIKAINDGAISYEEYDDILVKIEEHRVAEEKERIRQIIIDLLSSNFSAYDIFSAGMQKGPKFDPKDFEIPMMGYYPNYDSNYYHDHPGNNFYDNDGCSFTITDAITDGMIDFDSLNDIWVNIEARKEKAALEYKKKIEKERSLREAKIRQERHTVQKTSWNIPDLPNQNMFSLFDDVRSRGVEYEDYNLIRNNELFEIDSIDGLSFGICLDYYTIGSSLNSNGGFDNEYSKLGQMIHDLKYTSLSDSEKVSIIKDKLVPIVLEKTRDFSFWNKDMIIIPMPFTKQRTLQPVYEIAKELSRIKHKRYDNSILRKSSTTEAKTSDEEFADGVFSATYSGLETSVLIVDDTYGRGRSLRASIKALRKNPNIKFIYYLGIVKNRRGGLVR